MLKEAAYYSRMTLGLMDLLRIPPSADPQGTLRKQMEGRTEGFLEQVREYVFGAPPHPYRAMFELAGCELGDLENMVRREGLEKTLHRLRDSGVYLLHDELKGKQPIVRGGREIPGNPDSFLKPGGGGRWTSQTGRSRSNGTSTAQSPAYRAHRNCYDAILAEEFALQERDCVMLFPILPAAYGFSRARSMYRSGVPVTRWFAVGGGLREAGHYRLVTRALVAEARLLGWPLPWPQFLDASDFMPVVRHLEEAGARGRKTLGLQRGESGGARGRGGDRERYLAGGRLIHCRRRSSDRRQAGDHRTERRAGARDVHCLRGRHHRIRVQPDARKLRSPV